MKKGLLKRMMSVALAALLTATTVPAGSLTADAKSSVPTEKKCTSLSAESNIYDMDKDEYLLQVEAGNSFYIGDLVSAGIKYSNGQEFARCVTGLDATYKTSDASVAAVSKTGYVTPKATGTAKITVKYMKKSLPVKVKVVKKGSFKRLAKVNKNDKKLAKITKSFKGVFNEKNAAKMIKTVKKGKAIVEPYYFKDYNAARISMESGFGADSVGDGYYNANNKLIYTGCLHFTAMDNILSNEIYMKYNPFYRHTANPVTIKSIAATKDSSKATITLSREITALEYQMLTYAAELKMSNKPYVGTYIVADDMPKYLTWIQGEIKKNSDTIEVELVSAIDNEYNSYYPDNIEATAAVNATTEKLMKFRSGVTYSFYTSTYFNEDGSVSYADKDESWTDNYQLKVE